MTYQPPGGAPPEPTPYAQPQDPWAGGHEPGVAAAPTDPIPQQQQPYAAGGYAPGVASPSVWTQETMAQGGPYGYAPPQPAKSRTGLIVSVIAAVVVLGVGIGYGAYYVVTHRGGINTPQGQNSTTAGTDPTTGSTGPTLTPTLNAAAVKLNDCLFNYGTKDEPQMQPVPCTKPDSYKVIKIQAGAQIPEGPSGKFDRDVTSAAMCAGTNYSAWYGWDSSDDTKDLFFCLTTN